MLGSNQLKHSKKFIDCRHPVATAPGSVFESPHQLNSSSVNKLGTTLQWPTLATFTFVCFNERFDLDVNFDD